MSDIISVGIGVFRIIWTILTFRMGGRLFALFGVFFFAAAIMQAGYPFKNAVEETVILSFILSLTV